MYEAHIVWSDGSMKYRDTKISNYAKKGMETVPELTESKTVKLFFVGDCMIFLTKNGQVYQKGNLTFESQKEKQEKNTVKKLAFEAGVKIKDIQLGRNHILFLDTEGNVYSLGSNYYGQLGVGNKMIGYKGTPFKIKLTKIDKIYVHKNTSFAINKNQQLYMWGNAEFIPEYTGNIFKPKLFFPDLKVLSLKHDSDRMLMKTAKVEKEELEEKKQRERKAFGIIRYEEGEHRNLEEKFPNIRESQKSIGKSMLGRSVVEEIKEKKPAKLDPKLAQVHSENYEKFSEVNNELNNLLKYLFKEGNDGELEKLKQLITKQSEILMTDDSHQDFKLIQDILYFLYLPHNQLKEKEKQKILNSNFLTLASQEYLKENKMEELIENFKKEAEALSSEDKNVIENIEEEIKVDDYSPINSANPLSIVPGNLKERNTSFIKDLFVLLAYNLKYKTLEDLTFRMSVHDFILNTYEPKNTIEALEEDFKNSFCCVEKTKLILEKGEMIKRNLLKIYEKNLKKIDEVIPELYLRPNSLQDKVSFPEYSENFLYKSIIESSVLLKDLWESVITKVSEENEKREEMEINTRHLDTLREINGIENYLKKIQFDFPTKREKNEPSILKVKYNQAIQGCAQIDGAITRLSKIKEILFEDKLDSKLKQMILMYLSSIIQIAFTKKAIWMIVKEMSFS